MAAPNWWVPFITATAKRMNLDPKAVLAIAQHEGLSGNAGDHNTSFGPFQLHRGGALPAGKGRAWAESRAGITYALRKMSGVAAGLTGRAAVTNISRRFEHPANPAAEIADAMAHYGHVGGGGGSTGASRPLPGGMNAGTGGDSKSFQQDMVGYLIDAAKNGGQMDASSLMQLAQMRQGLQAGQGTGDSPAQIGASVAGGNFKGKGINELFYDPLGGIKHDKQIGAIGGHGDHVHAAANTAREMVQMIQHAQRMGMHVGENAYVTGKIPTSGHVHDSNHYRVLGKVGGRTVTGAADISGSAAQMAAFYKWASNNY